MNTLTFKQGIHPDYHKELTRDKPLKKAERPERVVIPLQQHIGAPNKPLVKKGDRVKMGQKIGDSDSFVSAPVHASVSGVVEEIKKVKTPVGSTALAIIIKADEEDEYADNVKSPGKLEDLSPEKLRKIIREAGMVGMGGAMFPTHVKLSVPDDKKVDYFILNGAECEPYLTVDHRTMIEKADDVLLGMKVMMKASGAEKGIIAVEDNKPEAIESMKSVVKDEPNIEVKVFETKYPQGGEKMLIKAALGREVPMGGLPLDVGVIVNNVTTAVTVARVIKEGMPLVERTITVTGSGINEPCNLIYRIGTPIQELIDQAGGLKEKTAKIVLGGPMTGFSQSDTSVAGVKGTSGILVMLEDDIPDYTSQPCIRCARCVDSCPMYLMPVQLGNYVEQDMVDEMDEYNILNCIECGCCSYVCPSNRPLVHYMKIGKAEVMAKRKNEG